MTTESPGFLTRPRTRLFGIWAWFVFICCIFFGLLVALLVPGQRLRSRLTTAASRGIFVLSGARVTVRGHANLPSGNAVVVANHGSYLDGLLLKGYLPSRFSFVIKGEMRDIAIAHFLLRRAGSRFVERHEATGSSRDARQIVKAASRAVRPSASNGGQSSTRSSDATRASDPSLSAAASQDSTARPAGAGALTPGADAASTESRSSVAMIR